MLNSNKIQIVLVTVVAHFCLAAAIFAGETTISGYIAEEGRAFLNSAAFDEQHGGDQFSIVLQPELRWRSENGDDKITLIPFARLDSVDSERSHADLREAYWFHAGDAWEFVFGLNKVFWGVAESRHLVDIINQTDGIEDIDGEDKLGQPMIMFGLQKDWGELQFYLLPYFRKHDFPGNDGRLRGPLKIQGDAQYESSAEEWRQDTAIRYSHYIGDWDVGLSYFHGTSREPVLRPDPAGDTLVRSSCADVAPKASVSVRKCFSPPSGASSSAPVKSRSGASNVIWSMFRGPCAPEVK